MTKNMAKYVLWQSSQDNLWHWHLFSDKNNKIVCWAEGYSSKQAAKDSIEWTKANAPTALTEER